MCFGQYRFTDNWKEHQFPSTAPIPLECHPLRIFADDIFPPISIITEYISDAVPLTPLNMTEEVAQEIMVRLDSIHKCHIWHGDEHPRNILLSQSKGPVWVSVRINDIQLASKAHRQCRLILIARPLHLTALHALNLVTVNIVWFMQCYLVQWYMFLSLVIMASRRS